jgi:hypothetical protein
VVGARERAATAIARCAATALVSMPLSSPQRDGWSKALVENCARLLFFFLEQADIDMASAITVDVLEHLADAVYLARIMLFPMLLNISGLPLAVVGTYQAPSFAPLDLTWAKWAGSETQL